MWHRENHSLRGCSLESQGLPRSGQRSWEGGGHSPQPQGQDAGGERGAQQELLGLQSSPLRKVFAEVFWLAVIRSHGQGLQRRRHLGKAQCKCRVLALPLCCDHACRNGKADCWAEAQGQGLPGMRKGGWIEELQAVKEGSEAWMLTPRPTSGTPRTWSSDLHNQILGKQWNVSEDVP